MASGNQFLDMSRLQQQGRIGAAASLTTSEDDDASAFTYLSGVMAEKEDDYFLVITNNGLSKDKTYNYNLYFDKKKVYCTETRGPNKKVTEYEYDADEIDINGKKCDKSFIKDFNKKVNKILDEYESKKASVWEPE